MMKSANATKRTRATKMSGLDKIVNKIENPFE